MATLAGTMVQLEKAALIIHEQVRKVEQAARG
jgi:hypothetical protein